MKYTWADVVVDPTSAKAKNAIGKEVYCADNPQDCLTSTNAGNRSYGVLQLLDPTDHLPFVVDGKHYECIIVKTTSTYEQNQAQWITDNNIKEGDYVKVLRKIGKDKEDWGDTWVPDMNDYIGSICEITEIRSDGIEIDSDYIFPYFVLEKTSDKYVPFSSSKEFLIGCSPQFKDDSDMLIPAIWVRNASGVYSLVTEIWGDGVMLGNSYDITCWEELLKDWVFMNGTPCGKPKI